MDFKKVTQTRINALLNELRSWEPEEERRTLHELSKMFRLEVWVVRSIAQSEGHDLKLGERLAGEELTEDEEEDDDEGIPEEIDSEADTGVYRQNPKTGEFERVEDVEEEG